MYPHFLLLLGDVSLPCVLFKVVFKNKASRPYSFHLQGVYDLSQGAGSDRTHGPSAPPGVPGEPVAPGEARTYNWRVTKKQGPSDSEFDCKTGAYYSTVDKVWMGLRLMDMQAFTLFLYSFEYILNKNVFPWKKIKWQSQKRIPLK